MQQRRAAQDLPAVFSSHSCIDVGKAILASARHLTNRLARKRLGPSFKVKRQQRTPPDRPLLLFEKCMQLAKDLHRAQPH